jgi:hypothetical protein
MESQPPDFHAPFRPIGQHLTPLDRIIMGALLGISSVALIQFLQLKKLDASLTLGLYCFAIAIPVLAMGLFVIHVQELYGLEEGHYPLFGDIVEMLGVLAAFAGIGAIFWHFHRLAGGVFVVVSVLAGLFALYHLVRVRRISGY